MKKAMPMYGTRRLLAVTIVLLMCTATIVVPFVPAMKTITQAKDDSTSSVYTFGQSDIANAKTDLTLSVPVNAVYLNATMTVTGAGDYPMGVKVGLGSTPGTSSYEFAGVGYGYMGRQLNFTNSNSSLNLNFTTGPGTITSKFYIPRNATISAGTISVTGNMTGMQSTKVKSYTCATTNNLFGLTTGFGDFNSDGRPDLAIGTPGSKTNSLAGMIQVYYYNQVTFGYNATPDRIYVGTLTESFGASVGTGDLNNDGADDLAVGVPNATGGSTDRGEVRIYLGAAGAGLPAVPSVVLQGDQNGAGFGQSVDIVDSVNGDAFDDIIVGAPDYKITTNDQAGTVRYWYGNAGATWTSGAYDLHFDGTVAFMNLGASVAGDFDSNNDNIGETVIGAPGITIAGPSFTGGIFVVKGANPDPTTADLIQPTGALDVCGAGVAGVGDLNGDGYDEVATYCVFAHGTGPYTREGKLEIYNGSATGTDLTQTHATVLTYLTANEYFGYTFAGGFDFNDDGYGDLLSAAPLRDTAKGVIDIFLGSPTGVVNKPAGNFTGTGTEGLGQSLSSMGMAGYNKTAAIGACGTAAGATGAAYVYNVSALAPKDLVVNITSSTGATAATTNIIQGTGPFMTTQANINIATAIGKVQADAGASNFTDSFGNILVEVIVNVTNAGAGGAVLLNDLNVTYAYDAKMDFKTHLVAYITAHKADAIAGMLDVPVWVKVASKGTVTLANILIEYNEAPIWNTTKMPTMYEAGEGNNTTVFKCTDYVAGGSGFTYTADWVTTVTGLEIGVNSDNFWVDATDIPNWTGNFRAKVTVTNSDGLSSTSPEFTVYVNNTNDAPAITSKLKSSDLDAEVNIEWSYTVTAVDGDAGDVLEYTLEGPQGMKISAATHKITWTPGFTYAEPSNKFVYVTVWVSDLENETDEQEFMLEVSGDIADNHAPEFTNLMNQTATVGTEFTYDLTFSDEDEYDELTFQTGLGVPFGLEAEQVSETKATITWTPPNKGKYGVYVSVTDGVEVTGGEFWIAVSPVGGNNAPKLTKIPDQTITDDFMVDYEYQCTASDADDDALIWTIDGPIFMDIDYDGLITWTFVDVGEFEITVTVSDGIEDVSETFVLTVNEQPPDPWVSFGTIDGQDPLTWSMNHLFSPVDGKIVFTGNVSGGTGIKLFFNDGKTNLTVPVNTDGSWTYEWDTTKLPNGPVNLTIGSTNNEGGSDMTVMALTVKNKESTGGNEGAAGSMMYILLVVVLVIVVVAVVAMVMMRKKKPAQAPAQMAPPPGQPPAGPQPGQLPPPPPGYAPSPAFQQPPPPQQQYQDPYAQQQYQQPPQQQYEQPQPQQYQDPYAQQQYQQPPQQQYQQPPPQY